MVRIVVGVCGLLSLAGNVQALESGAAAGWDLTIGMPVEGDEERKDGGRFRTGKECVDNGIALTPRGGRFFCRYYSPGAWRFVPLEANLFPPPAGGKQGGPWRLNAFKEAGTVDLRYSTPEMCLFAGVKWTMSSGWFECQAFGKDGLLIVD